MNDKIKILLVDDTPENIDTLGTLLKDYKRQVALNGERALELARKEPKPDLILLDIMMPGIGGYEVCSRLKADKETSSIPVIFLTSKTDRESVLKGFDTGAQDYITKPFDSRELLARVKTQIEIIVNKKKLEKVNDWLEEQVDIRTAELLESNKQLAKAQKELESLDASKSEFLRIISHEIRTPLNGIMGGLNILKDLEIAEVIDVLDKSVERLENFSISALDISTLRVNSSNQIKLEATDLLGILFYAEKIFLNKINSKNIKVVKNFDKETNLVNIDPEYFTKAIRSILDNAIKFSPMGGTIYIDCKFTKNEFVIIIKDEGKGFNEKMLSELSFLDSNEHIDKSPGLGLYLSFLVVQSHGGKLTYKNGDKCGAEVKIVIPILQPTFSH